eukprot:gene11488-15387_t
MSNRRLAVQIEPTYSNDQLKDMLSKRKRIRNDKGVDMLSYILLGIVLLITISTYPSNLESGKVTTMHVWYYGWITAVSTGAGALPFLFFHDPDKFWMGVSNAIAGGMMIAASVSLCIEGATFTDDSINLQPHDSTQRTAIGFGVGIIFIFCTKKLLDHFGDFQLESIMTDESGSKKTNSVSTQRVILIIIVMTLHSLTEGIGIGVSFGGKRGMQLGQFISLSLAVHNIPEGLAVALVMNSRKISPIRSGLWAIFTSLPQPITAIPAFIFVEKFVPLLPSGLGFAAGAMAYVALFELLVEATEETSVLVTAIVSLISSIIMMGMQHVVKISI